MSIPKAVALTIDSGMTPIVWAVGVAIARAMRPNKAETDMGIEACIVMFLFKSDIDDSWQRSVAGPLPYKSYKVVHCMLVTRNEV